MAASETPLEGAWDRPSRPPSRVREAPRPARLGRRFWSLWSAGTVSSLGDGLTQVALPLLAADLTRRPLLIAAVAVLDRLPTFLVGLPAGAYADRVDRRRLLRQVDLARAGLMGALAALVAVGAVSLPVLYAFAVVLGALEPFSFG
ncbi:MAG TPA: MFS transporter, partial [Acidimicrobiales bacterium]|nr:MFS transporter [Acidimicrobiales bacterium]